MYDSVTCTVGSGLCWFWWRYCVRSKSGTDDVLYLKWLSEIGSKADGQ